MRRQFRTAIFVLTRVLWVGLNAAFFLVAVWYSTLPPIEGTHPGFLLAPIWLVLLFPGNVAMLAAFSLLDALASPRLLATHGTTLFFSVWAGGALLTYGAWFVWLPRRVRPRRQVPEQADRANRVRSV